MGAAFWAHRFSYQPLPDEMPLPLELKRGHLAFCALELQRRAGAGAQIP